MNSVDFCYWLQGYFEISGATDITEEQLAVIKNHLNLVFKHEIDPMREEQTTATNTELDSIHNGWLTGNDPQVRC